MAALIEWQKKYQIGNQSIDSEHEQLFRLANQVLGLERTEDVIDQIKPILYDLYDYMQYHFKREEALMRQIGFPGLDEHQDQHQKIITALNQILKSSQNYDELIDRLSDLMAKWLLRHIIKEDFKLKQLLKSN